MMDALLRSGDAWRGGLGHFSGPKGFRMNKREFDRRKQLLWVYLRHDGKCNICGYEVNQDDIATDREIVEPLGTDDLLKVRLMHPFCRAAEARQRARRAAA
jgi:hypothetical protein